VTLSLNPTRGSKKEGAIAAFSLAPEFRVPLQAALDDGATGELSVRECRKAAMVALGLFRLVYWVGKQLRLTAWRVELAESQARFLEQQGVALHAMGSTTYQIRLSEVEERLLDFQGLRESFQEILNQRNVKTSSLGEFLNRVGSDSPFGENLEEAV
jgi:hypothetical protein